MTPEGEVKKEIRKALAMAGLPFFVPPVGGFGKMGISDFIVHYRQRVLFIEAKATSGSKLTRMQAIFRVQISDSECPYWVVDSSNVDELLASLRNFKEEIDLCFSNSYLPAKKS